ncbi:mannan endo-1,6-alpha-mannosidase [Acrasis kona]|uniref:Mannan endo-1,6-alpha-mannosidase n=1 Tax=Acrasis kona TaxID=1008807 RepID=A0AAW2ZMX4_9EUKA
MKAVLFASLLVLYTSVLCFSQRRIMDQPNERARAAAHVLQTQYFSDENGTYPRAIDWTSAVTLEAVIHYMAVTKDLSYISQVDHFYSSQAAASLEHQQFDDMYWVSNSWLEAAKLLKFIRPDLSEKYLQRSRHFFSLAFTGGWDPSTCGGGQRWGPRNHYKNAITNELSISTAMNIFEYTNEPYYFDVAKLGVDWFLRDYKTDKSMFNQDGLINDGLTDQCTNNKQTTWTYNQGVILSGFTRLFKHTKDAKYLTLATDLLDSILKSYLIDPETNSLVEVCDPATRIACNQDQQIFKGITIRHVSYMLDIIRDTKTQVANIDSYIKFVKAGAEAVWTRARDPSSGKIANYWRGGDFSRLQMTTETHVAGLEALVAAASL